MDLSMTFEGINRRLNKYGWQQGEQGITILHYRCNLNKVNNIVHTYGCYGGSSLVVRCMVASL